ncbi:MAG: hypothetical protein IKO57_05020 [Treponema sp.]|nr:hypothetical protein [Treponema sp.]MBR6912249.1 hypothetical protein [Treponema sp.]
MINFAHIDGEGKITGKQAEKAPLTSEAAAFRIFKSFRVAPHLVYLQIPQNAKDFRLRK